MPSPLDSPYVNFPSIYLSDADIPSIFGSEDNSRSSVIFK